MTAKRYKHDEHVPAYDDSYSNYPTHDEWMASRYASTKKKSVKDIAKAELIAAYDKLKKRNEKAKAPFVIQCPHCKNEDLESINICELEATLWYFVIDENKLIVDSGTQANGDYQEDTRHLYCQNCSGEWKVPTLAEVEWA